ncbi:MAG: ATPase [Lachnospiraceae bacterium]|nr:ATPase [Lachnospiraceae bacterium]
MIKILLVVALLLTMVIPFGAYAIGEKSRGRYKKYLALNVMTFFSVLIGSAVFGFADTAMAAEAVAQTSGSSLSVGMGYIAAAMSTGCSCIGGGIAVASAASAALGAISEDQSILGKSLIFVGLAEGVALYGLIISFMILGKL